MCMEPIVLRGPHPAKVTCVARSRLHFKIFQTQRICLNIFYFEVIEMPFLSLYFIVLEYFWTKFECWQLIFPEEYLCSCIVSSAVSLPTTPDVIVFSQKMSDLWFKRTLVCQWVSRHNLASLVAARIQPCWGLFLYWLEGCGVADHFKHFQNTI